MTATKPKPDIAAYHAQLARAFSKRRCSCGAPAHSVAPGDVPMREVGIVLRRGAPDRNYCLRCAGLDRGNVAPARSA